MRPIQRFIHAGFATAAIASASVPALAWTVWPEVDFEWNANGSDAAVPAVQREVVVPNGSTYSTTDRMIRDREGNAIPATPDAYPVEHDTR